MIVSRMLYRIFLIGTLWLPSVLSAACIYQDSVFPNLDALACESYFSCHDFVPHIHDCPEGYQFHYANLQCQPSGQVLCEWQRENFLRPYGASGTSEYYDYGFNDLIVDPIPPPPNVFVDPIDVPVLQPPPIGFLPRISMFPSLPAIDLSLSALATDLMSILGPMFQPGFTQVPLLPFPSPFGGNTGVNTRTGYGNMGTQSSMPTYYPAYPLTEAFNVDPFFGQYASNPMPLFSTVNSIPRSGYIPGLTDRNTIGVPYPVFTNINNNPNSGFIPGFNNGIPLPIVPTTTTQQSGYIPRIASQNSPNSMTTNFPGVSTSVPSFGVIGQLFPINIPGLGLVGTGQTGIGQGSLGSNVIPGINVPSFSQPATRFTGTQPTATGTNMLGGSAFPSFANFLNFTFPLFGSNGNGGLVNTRSGLGGFGTPSYQGNLGGVNFPSSGSTTATIPFPLGLGSTQLGTPYNAPPSPVWNVNINTGTGIPMNTMPYPITFINPSSNFIPRNSFPTGAFSGSTFGSNTPTPLGFGVSTGFSNQPSGYVTNGFNQANTFPNPIGFGNNPGFVNFPSYVKNGGYTPQSKLGVTFTGTRVPSGFNLGSSGGYLPPYPIGSTGATNNPVIVSNPSGSGGYIPSSFGGNNNPVPIGFGSPNSGGSFQNAAGYQPSSGSTNNAYSPNVSSYVPNTSGYVPNTGGNVPNASGFIPNTSGYVPNTSGNVPNTSGYVPNTSGYVPNTSGYVPPNTGYTPTNSGSWGNPSNVYPIDSSTVHSGSVVLGGFPGSSYNPNSLGFTTTGTGQIYVPKYGLNSPSNSGSNTGYVPNYASGTNTGYAPNYASGTNTGYAPNYDSHTNTGYAPNYASGTNTGYAPNYDSSTNTGYAPNYASNTNTGYAPNYASGTNTGYAPKYDSSTNTGNAPNYDSHTNTGYAPNYDSNTHSDRDTSSTGFGVVYPSNSDSVAKSGGFQGFELGTLTSGPEGVNSETISKDRDFRSTSNDTAIVSNVSGTSTISGTVIKGNDTLSVTAG